MRQIVYASLPLGEGRVLDPFMGGGSTIAAADFLGYESVGIEIDPHYYAVANDGIPRLKNLYLEKDISEDQDLELDHIAISEDSIAAHPKKRGRPKKKVGENIDQRILFDD
ncbi:MAG: hypothetical protein OHK0022_20770 [Roseiflexaceae bacterium]